MIVTVLDQKRNACLQLVRKMNRKVNEIRYGLNEGPSHREKKDEICKKLLAKDKFFVTEAIIESIDIRADILVLDDYKIIEVVNTEGLSSILRKKELFDKINLKYDFIHVNDEYYSV